MEFPFINDILLFFQSIWDWLFIGIYSFVKQAFVLLTKMMIYSYFKGLLFALDVAYEVYEQIMNEIGVSQKIQQIYGGLNSDVRSAIAFFGIPDAINILVSAIGTRFSMKFIPFIGR